MGATEVSRGFSDLHDAVEGGETVTVTIGGHVVAGIRPASPRTGRHLDATLGASRLTDADAAEMSQTVAETQALLLPYDGDTWADD